MMLGWFKKPPPEYFGLCDEVEDESQELSERATTPVVDCLAATPARGDEDA